MAANTGMGSRHDRPNSLPLRILERLGCGGIFFWTFTREDLLVSHASHLPECSRCRIDRIGSGGARYSDRAQPEESLGI